MSDTNSLDDTARLVADARGEIDEALFTQTGSGGLVSDGYLADRPPAAYLDDDEQPHYLLAGGEGVTVRRRAGVEATDDDHAGVYTAGGGHRAAALVTDARVVFLVGRESGNEVVELPVWRVEATSSDSGLMHGKLTVSDDRYEYVFKTERKAAVEEAADYIRDRAAAVDGPTSGVGVGDHELLPERLGEYTTDDAALHSADEGDLEAVRSDLAWLTEIHTRLAADVADSEESSDITDNEEVTDTRSLLGIVEELLSTLQVVESVLSEAEETEDEPAVDDVAEAQSAVAGTPVDGSRLDRLADALDSDNTTQSDGDTDDTAETETSDAEESSSGETDSESTPAEQSTDSGPFIEPDIIEPKDTPPLSQDAPELQRDLQRLVGTLHRIPTREDVVEHGEYEIDAFERYGDTWEAVLASAGFDTHRGQMLAAIQQCHDQLGYVPDAAELAERTAFEREEYTSEFGSVTEALTAAGIDYESAVRDALAAAADEVGAPPTKTEFAEISPYDPTTVETFFDSWDDALAAAGVRSLDDESESSSGGSEPSEDDTGGATQTADGRSTPPRSPLSEWYDLLYGLRTLQRAIYGPDVADLPDDDPGAAWTAVVDAAAGSTGLEHWDAGYGYQHQSRVDHTASDYRDTYGDGDRVTDFSAVETTPVPESIALVADGVDTASLSLPVAPDSETPLPVVVTTEAELDRARSLLSELPPQPPATVGERDDGPSTPTGTEEPSSGEAEDTRNGGPADGEREDSTTDGDQVDKSVTDAAADEDETSTADVSGEKAQTGGSAVADHPAVDELTSINGIERETARTLIGAGYDSVDALAEATTADLTSLDGIDSVRAFRITFALDD
jgi:predicted flap endonuclease-1-like 5' DNA nuclease